MVQGQGQEDLEGLDRRGRDDTQWSAHIHAVSLRIFWGSSVGSCYMGQEDLAVQELGSNGILAPVDL